MTRRQGLKETLLAYAVWAASCAGCVDKPQLYVSDSAATSFSTMRSKAVSAGAERINCLELRADTIIASWPSGWQVVAPDGTTARSFSDCKDGWAHPHIFPAPGGGLDSLFSKGDLRDMEGSKVYCVIYAENRARCRTPTWEGVVYYGR